MNNVKRERIKNDFEPIKKLLIDFREKYKNNIKYIEYVSALRPNNHSKELEPIKQIHIVLYDEAHWLGCGERIIIEA